MLDNILNSVKRGAERVQRRSEEVAQVARLKMEVFQLTRELDGHYARLGRSYHAGADLDLLQGIREDIRRVEEEIASRERLITELGDTPEAHPGAEGTAESAKTSIQVSPSTTTQSTSPATPSAPAPAISATASSPADTVSLDPGNRPAFTEQEQAHQQSSPSEHSSATNKQP